jgi:hypothetical protein
LEQVPAQPIHRAGPLGDEIVAVIEQQPDLHRPLIQVRGRELLDPVAHDRAGDRQRVDLIGLPRPALAFPGRAHAVRRDSHHPLAGRQQRPLEPARDGTAVLDRPHPLVVQSARPTHRGQMPRLVGLDLALAALPAAPRIDRRQRVRALVRVRPDHDHLPPSLRLVDHRRSGSPADNCHWGPMPRSY